MKKMLKKHVIFNPRQIFDFIWKKSFETMDFENSFSLRGYRILIDSFKNFTNISR